jgi:hypothetical protein
MGDLRGQRGAERGTRLLPPKDWNTYAATGPPPPKFDRRLRGWARIKKHFIRAHPRYPRFKIF